nr:hypothetical protein [Actinomycetes bacterium]
MSAVARPAAARRWVRTRGSSPGQAVQGTASCEPVESLVMETPVGTAWAGPERSARSDDLAPVSEPASLHIAGHSVGQWEWVPRDNSYHDSGAIERTRDEPYRLSTLCL